MISFNPSSKDIIEEAVRLAFWSHCICWQASANNFISLVACVPEHWTVCSEGIQRPAAAAAPPPSPPPTLNGFVRVSTERHTFPWTVFSTLGRQISSVLHLKLVILSQPVWLNGAPPTRLTSRAWDGGRGDASLGCLSLPQCSGFSLCQLFNHSLEFSAFLWLSRYNPLTPTLWLEHNFIKLSVFLLHWDPDWYHTILLFVPTFLLFLDISSSIWMKLFP